MSKERSDLRLLLLQIREDPKVRIEELESFADHGGLNSRQISIHNVFDEPEFGPEIRPFLRPIGVPKLHSRSGETVVSKKHKFSHKLDSCGSLKMYVSCKSTQYLVPNNSI